MIPDFDVRTVNRHERAIVFVTGEIDLFVGDRFREAVLAAQSTSTDVIVDFTDVTYIGSTGINVLVRARHEVADRNRLRVVGARPSVRRIFEIAKLADLLLEEDHELTWKQVTDSRSGWRQWVTHDLSEDGAAVAEIVEMGAWAGFGTDDAQYLLDMSGQTALYGSLADAMKAAEVTTSVTAVSRRHTPQS
jgi:anti-anti-sigma factor